MSIADERYLKTIETLESGGRPGLVSSKNARGLMQVVPATANDPGFGVTPARDDSEREYTRVGREYALALKDKYHGDIPLALAAYNAGPGTVDKLGGVPNYKETQDYVRKGMAMMGGSEESPPTHSYDSRIEAAHKYLEERHKRQADAARWDRGEFTPEEVAQYEAYDAHLGNMERWNRGEFTPEEIAQYEAYDVANAPPVKEIPEAPKELPVPLSTKLSDIGTVAEKGGVGVIQGIVGLGDMVSGGRVGKAVEDMGIDLAGSQQALKEQYSPQIKEGMQEIQDAQGFAGNIKAVMDHPVAALAQFGESIPSMYAGGVLTKAAKVAKVLQTGAGQLAALGAGEGLIETGTTAEGYRSQSKDKLLHDKEAGAALGTGLGVGVISALGGKLLGNLDIDTVFSGGLRRAVADTEGEAVANSPGFFKRFMAATVGNAAEEGAQGAQGKMWQNYVEDKPLMKDVDNQAYKDSIMGAIGGAAFSPFTGEHQQPSEPTPTDNPDQTHPALTAQQQEVIAENERKVASNKLRDMGMPSRNKLHEKMLNADYSTEEGIKDIELDVFGSLHGVSRLNWDKWAAFLEEKRAALRGEPPAVEEPPAPVLDNAIPQEQVEEDPPIPEPVIRSRKPKEPPEVQEFVQNPVEEAQEPPIQAEAIQEAVQEPVQKPAKVPKKSTRSKVQKDAYRDAIAPEEFAHDLSREEFAESLGTSVAVQEAFKDTNETLKAVNEKGLGPLMQGTSNPILHWVSSKASKVPGLTISHDMSKVPKGSIGGFDPATNSVYVPQNSPHATAHELTHAVVYNAIQSPNAAQKPHVTALQALYDGVKDHRFIKSHYGATNLQEFVAEGLSNPEFQYQLSRIQYKPKGWTPTTVWGLFTQKIADILGLKNSSAFLHMLHATDNIAQKARYAAPSTTTSAPENIVPARARRTTPPAQAPQQPSTPESIMQGANARRASRTTPQEPPPLSKAERVKHALYKSETLSAYSGAMLTNTVRDAVGITGLPWKDQQRLMVQADQSQAVHYESVAGIGALMGDLVKDPTTTMWKAEINDHKVANVRAFVNEVASKYGISEVAANHEFGELMTALRAKDIYAKAAKHTEEAKQLPTPEEQARHLHKYRKSIAVSRNLHMTPQQVAESVKLLALRPEYKKAMDEWHAVRKNVIDFMVKTGRYTTGQAEAYMDAAMYVPWQRVMNDVNPDAVMDTLGKSRVGLLKSQNERGIKGSKTREVDDILVNMEKFVINSYARGLRNDKNLELIDLVRSHLPKGSVVEVTNSKNKGAAIPVYRNGEKEHWLFKDPLMRHAFTGGEAADMARGVLATAAKASNFLRLSVVMNPVFTVGQLFLQDSYAAMFTSGLKNPFTLPLHITSEFIGTLAGGTKAHRALKPFGIVGQKDPTNAISESIHEIYNGSFARGTGIGSSIARFLEHIAAAGDNATRQAVYKQTLKEMKGNPNAELIANQRALELINFRKRGASVNVDYIRRITPFLGAYIQAQRVAYNVLSGRGIAPAYRTKKAALKVLATTSVGVFALSFLYNALMGGDDDFDKRDAQEKDTHIFLPGSHIALPIRSDIFSLPYVLANHTYGVFASGLENPHTARVAIQEALLRAMFNVPMGPTLVKGVGEVALNKDLYTMRDIIPTNLQNMDDPREQYSATTSDTAKLLSKGLYDAHIKVSPLHIDHLIKSYFATVGIGTVTLADMALRKFTDTPYTEAEGHSVLGKNLRDIPGVAQLYRKDSNPQDVNELYRLRDAIVKGSGTVSKLKLRGHYQEAEAYKTDEERRRYMGGDVKRVVNKIAKDMTAINKNIEKIRETPNNLISPKEKRERIDDLESRRDRVAAQVHPVINRVYPR
jgi:Large polyvalent protein associated domain 38/Transglycosylase SLT domain